MSSGPLLFLLDSMVRLPERQLLPTKSPGTLYWSLRSKRKNVGKNVIRQQAAVSASFNANAQLVLSRKSAYASPSSIERRCRGWCWPRSLKPEVAVHVALCETRASGDRDFLPGSLLALTGCGKSKINQANFDKLEKGMTLEEVEHILATGRRRVATAALSRRKWALM